MANHIPVLKNEVLDYLSPALISGGLVVDATVGAGGHAKAILENNPQCQLIGIDQDQSVFKIARENLKKFQGRVELINSNFADLVTTVTKSRFYQSKTKIAAILFDLGISSIQLDQADRGFSFRNDGPLDMRMNQSQNLTAAEIINHWPQIIIEQILREKGEEWQFKKIARAIVESRQKQKIETTDDLVRVLESALNIRYGGKGMRIHPATKTFQALRIAVNHELYNLAVALPQAIDLLAVGGRIAVISFHSLEDRIVKNIFRNLTKNCLCPIEQPECNCGNNNAKLKILTKKPVTPSNEEIQTNPRSRSAKMRVAEAVKARIEQKI